VLLGEGVTCWWRRRRRVVEGGGMDDHGEGLP